MSHLRPLTLAITLALPLIAAADEPDSDKHRHEAKRLDAVEVTASPLRSAIEDLARPVEVLVDAELDQRKSGTLGETLARESGVQSSFFGAGVGRPVIRGQEGARVQVLTGGTGSLDVSTVSADHAVAIEPFLADQIEVLKGPATLLYGSGAIGGAVNVVDGRIPTMPVDASLTGRAELRHGSGSNEATGMLRLDGDVGALTWHLDAFNRDADDYRIPGFAFSDELIEHEVEEGEDPAHFASARMPNSALRNRGGALGASWFGERSWFGAALSRYQSNYGIPPGAHAHEDDHEDDLEGDHEEESEAVRIDMAQTRLDARGGIRELGVIEELNFRLSRNNYRHLELEDDAIGTRFDNDASELRIEAVQREFKGWRGAFGVQDGRRDFRAVGDEAFLPATESRDTGIFVLQEREFGDFKLEAGARHDRVSIDLADGSGGERRSANSLSLATLWKATEALHLSLGLDRAQRAPSAEELFSDGPHIATGSYERGDAGLRVETARSAEIGLHLHVGRVEAQLSAYRTRFDDYIYLGETGIEIEALPVRRWQQDDARFEGWEAKADIELADNASGLWSLSLLADQVDARLDDGRRLPRIAPGRFGADIDWSRGGWRARLGAIRVAAQNDVAELESPTPGYTLVDAHLSYHWDSAGGIGWEVFVDGRNLGDRDARVHTSYLKDFAPLPGRSIQSGVRILF
ncbi:MAG TPA: TonB-dependent receptor [Arenimonas sp.]|nr:TonB-dependent receptor [Arenimonas sp.]